MLHNIINLSSFSYEDLFQYIKNNKILPEKIDSVSLKDPNLVLLQEAVKKGDLNNPIFANADCDIYLLSLFKHKKIEPEEFLTAYNFLMALMEFSDKQPLKKEDDFLKSDLSKVAAVNTLPIFQDEKITEIGKIYLDHICDKFETELNIILNRNELETFIRSLPPAEQLLLNINFNDYNSQEILKEIAILTPTILMIPDYADKDKSERYYFPSYSLQNYLRDPICREPILFKPRFGRIGNKTHLKMHQENFHIYPLYNKHVRSNLIEAHELKSGPFSIAKHDEGHGFWACMLERERREVILKDFVSDLRMAQDEIKLLKNSDKDINLQDLLKNIDQIIFEKINDLLFLRLFDYKDLSQEDRLKKYLEFCFYIKTAKDSFTETVFDKIGSDLYADLYYVIAKIYLSNSGRQPDLWKHIFDKLNQIPQTEAQKAVQQALLNLANASFTENKITLENNNVQINQDQWQAWFNTLSNTKDSETIWNWARKEEQNSLIMLINHCNLIFFHPFLPLNDEKHAQLLKFVQNQLDSKLESENTLGYVSGLRMFGSESSDDKKKAEEKKDGALFRK